MRKVILYIAMSLDGYIADEKGGVNWLAGDGSETSNQGSFPNFFESIDTIIMGYSTYHQVVTHLSPEVWPYAGKECFIITHRQLESNNEINFINHDLYTLIDLLKNRDGKDIWICGCANIANQLIKRDLIDRFCISIIPSILGNGIQLFSTHEKEMRLKLISTQRYNINNIIYFVVFVPFR